jgi:hypothetical protein
LEACFSLYFILQLFHGSSPVPFLSLQRPANSGEGRRRKRRPRGRVSRSIRQEVEPIESSGTQWKAIASLRADHCAPAAMLSPAAAICRGAAAAYSTFSAKTETGFYGFDVLRTVKGFRHFVDDAIQR